MERTFFIFVLFTWAIHSSLFGQEIIFKEEFNALLQEEAISGVQGNGLNLTQSAEYRQRLSYVIDQTKWKKSFTISMWIKGEKDFESYNLLDLEIKYADSTMLNWKFNKQANHTWAWELIKAKKSLDYKPGPSRQLITEGWTLISMSYDSPKQEVALYYNGNQVAIYSLEGMEPASEVGTIGLRIGGEKQGDLGEWEVFNGYIDDISLYNTNLSSDQIREIFNTYFPSERDLTLSKTVDSLRVMTYNIWHGGNETGKGIGYKRVAEVIRASGADIITMQETYGSGARIADELGYYFYLRSSNISIMSRFPIKETLKSSTAFNNGNALIEIGKQHVVVSSVWLNYPVDYWSEIDNGRQMNLKEWIEKQEGNRSTMEGIIQSLSPQINASNRIPIILGGDFNSGSHLDWVESVKDKNAGYVMPFPTSKYMERLGFKDTFREVYKDPKKFRGITWTPINPHTHQDRIDYIFFKGKGLKTLDSKVIDTHPVRFPSDHAAVLTTFLFINQ